MEEAFENLKKQGKTDVDSLVKWLKDSKVIGEAKATEEKARTMLTECAEKKKVEFEKFKEVVAKLAAEQKTNLEEMYKTLAEQGPKVFNAVSAGVSAFKEALNTKK